MEITYAQFFQKFIRLADDGWQQGWHERNGGNLTYRMTSYEVDSTKESFRRDNMWHPIRARVPGLAGDYFLVTGTGKYFRNVSSDPKTCTAVIEIDGKGENYAIRWGLTEGGLPTSELPTHLLNHEIKKKVTDGKNRVIYHAHPTNVIALSFILPIDNVIWTRELWEMMTECPLIFPEGIGVTEWMVPGGESIGLATSKLMQTYNAVVWAHHGMFCSGEDFDSTFALMHTIEKSAEILLKVMSVRDWKHQTITPDDFRNLAKAYNLDLPEKYLYDKDLCF